MQLTFTIVNLNSFDAKLTSWYIILVMKYVSLLERYVNNGSSIIDFAESFYKKASGNPLKLIEKGKVFHSLFT